jgi:hypothetical protein
VEPFPPGFICLSFHCSLGPDTADKKETHSLRRCLSLFLIPKKGEEEEEEEEEEKKKKRVWHPRFLS